MNIREAHEKFSTDEQCLAYIEKMRWPDGIVRCPTCGDKNVEKYERPATNPKKRRSKTRDAEKENKRGWFYICQNADCRQQFSPTSGTIFHDTHLPLIVWFQAITLMLNAKKGISAKQLQRDLGIGGYKTAWYLNHRIREVMSEADIPKLGGIVEVDETYVGGKQKGKGVYYGKKQKQVVVGVRQRQGPLRFIHTKDAKANTLKTVIAHYIAEDVQYVMTDDSSAASAALKDTGKHKVIRHSIGSYVDGMIHTNTVESAFSLLKRGIVGSFHKVSIKHLQRYLDEFSYRFNRRKDDGAFIETVRRLCGFKPLPFATLTTPCYFDSRPESV
jgi:transposase-like protein